MKYYFLFFFVFCLLVGGGLYAFNPTPIPLSFFSYDLSIPLSLWVIGSVTLFFLLSLILLASQWTKARISSYFLDRDLEHFIEALRDQILEKSPNFSYKSKAFQSLAKIFKRLKIQAKIPSDKSENPRIDALFEDLASLQKGQTIKTTLEPNSAPWIQNMQNRIQEDSKFALKIIEGDYESSLKESALTKLLQEGNLSEKTIHKLIAQKLDPTQAHILLQGLLQRGYKLGKSDCLTLLQAIDAKELIAHFKSCKHVFDPDFCIQLFKELAQARSDANLSYAYVLLDYSMMDEAREFLSEHEELTLARAYLELRQNPAYKLDDFFPPKASSALA